MLYTSVFLEQTELLPPTVGVVDPGRPAEGKLEPGDRILAVDGEEITSYPEVNRVIQRSANRPVKLMVARDDRTIDVTVTPADEARVRELDIVEHKRTAWASTPGSRRRSSGSPGTTPPRAPARAPA